MRCFLQFLDNIARISWELQGNASKYFCATVEGTGKKLSGVERNGVMERSEISVMANFNMKSTLKMQYLFRVSYMGVKPLPKPLITLNYCYSEDQLKGQQLE